MWRQKIVAQNDGGQARSMMVPGNRKLELEYIRNFPRIIKSSWDNEWYGWWTWSNGTCQAMRL
jgi:hypothetical protein